MADNYIDKQMQDFEARQARKAKAHKEKLRRYREAYIRSLKQKDEIQVPEEHKRTQKT